MPPAAPSQAFHAFGRPEGLEKTITLPCAETRDCLLSKGAPVETDVRGNLGPGSVITQDPPGDDWIKDRWQAASDMGGTAIPGSHWITLDMSHNVVAGRVVLDWEAAYAKDYRIEVAATKKDADADKWTLLHDNANELNDWRRKESTSGQSPGVTYTMPLHVVHAIDLTLSNPHNYVQFRYAHLHSTCGSSHMRIF